MRLKTQHADIERGANILSIDIPDELKRRCKTGIKFIDDAFGGKGMTPSVCTLFTGTPGAGKTTLMLQLADSLTRQGHVCLFNTAEESLYQVRGVVDRLNLRNGFVCGQDSHVPTLLFERRILVSSSSSSSTRSRPWTTGTSTPAALRRRRLNAHSKPSPTIAKSITPSPSW